MNDYDQRNLEFLLAIGDSEDEFEEFVLSLPLDDVQYAMELLQKHASQLVVQKMEANDDIEDVSHAVSILNKIKESTHG